MDGVALLEEAVEAGLCVTAEGNRLVIQGPGDAEAIAERLIAAKPAVMAVLAERGGVWWEEQPWPSGMAPIRHPPPRGCVAPTACSRLGHCPRYAAGGPCRVAS